MFKLIHSKTNKSFIIYSYICFTRKPAQCFVVHTPKLFLKVLKQICRLKPVRLVFYSQKFVDSDLFKDKFITTNVENN